MAAKTLKGVTVTARIPVKLSRRLEHYAKIAGRSKSWVVQDILSRYVDGEIAFVEAVNVGIASADRGDLMTTEDVFRGLRARSAEHRKSSRRKAA